jgi:tetratricopeptide (TPR) repeat protein/predicted Ser/Thr protein kinase
MNVERRRQIEEVYRVARRQESGRVRVFLAEACGADEELRSEVEALLNQPLCDALTARPNEALSAAQPSGAFTAARGRFQPANIGHYRVLRLLGEGGMGAVYEAEQENPRRIAALKVIKPGLISPELLRRFEHEARALGRLQHPGIAQIYEAGTAETGFGPQQYFAMEFIRGRSLLEYAGQKQLNTRERLDLMVKICEAVHHAHQRGLIHRDLKPSNILVDETGQPKILDFGVARATDSDAQATRQTDLGQLVGTLAYMSPEQVLGDPLELDTRSDVYALGVILYELLAGRMPYSISQKLHEVVQVIKEEDPAPLSPINRIYRGDVETIVAKALEKDKTRRYASAADLGADIQRYLDDEPIMARPTSAIYQLQKFARRHTALVAGVAVTFVVLTGGIVASTWQAARATRERDRATAAEHRATTERDRALSAEKVASAARAQALQERNRAVAEKQRADIESATAKAINDFLQDDLLSQAGAVPGRLQANAKPDPDLKVRTALDRAAERIGGKFDAQPLLEASIRQTIGMTYAGLGLWAEAQREVERAVDLRRRVLGEKNRETLDSMSNLASLYREQGKYAPAETLFNWVLEAQRHALGEENSETLGTINDLAIVYQGQGKYAQAATLFAKAMDGRRRIFGEGHPLTLTNMSNLAFVYRNLGKYALAEQLTAKALDGRRRVLGEEHPSTLMTMSNLALIYRTTGKDALAEPLARKVAETRRRVLGQEHPDTLNSMSILAQVYMDEGREAEAEQLFTEVLNARRRLMGEEHPSTLRSMNYLADLYRSQRKEAQAEALFTKILEVGRRVLGPDHPSLTIVLTSLGRMRLEQQKYAEAETLLREALSGQKKKSPDAWERYDSQSLLGASLAGQQKYADAEPLMVSGYQGLVQREIPWESRSTVQQAGERISQLYRDWGRPEKASEWREKLQQGRAPGPQTP